MNIGMKEAQRRLREKLCLECGTEKQTNTELNSCSNPKCVKALRPLYRWANGVAKRLSVSDTTYFNSVQFGGHHGK